MDLDGYRWPLWPLFLFLSVLLLPFSLCFSLYGSCRSRQPVQSVRVVVLVVVVGSSVGELPSTWDGRASSRGRWLPANLGRRRQQASIVDVAQQIRSDPPN